jgi:hypothetical protein
MALFVFGENLSINPGEFGFILFPRYFFGMGIAF